MSFDNSNHGHRQRESLIEQALFLALLALVLVFIGGIVVTSLFTG